jgi:CelD/BcsL family acetyltransferase involved in cellulose biosynthesis
MLITVDPVEDSRWDDFIMKHPESTIFHHAAWAQVLRDRYQRKPKYRVVENNCGEIVAAIPLFSIRSPLTGNRLVCLPGAEYCFPIADSGESLFLLMDALRTEVDNGSDSFLEIRGWGGLVVPAELGLVENPYYLRHVASLDGDPERLRARLFHESYHLRRNLRKAEKSGIVVREAESEDDLKKFHQLTEITRKRLCLLPWPYQFLQVIYRYVVKPGYGFLLLAELGDKTIAGSMYFCFGDTTTLKFNASDRNYAQYRGNYLVTWKAMEHACLEGYRQFDFGICNPENHGLARFKSYWGTEETVYPYYYYPARRGIGSVSQSNFLYQAYTAFNRITPKFALKLVSKALYRHLG